MLYTNTVWIPHAYTIYNHDFNVEGAQLSKVLVYMVINYHLRIVTSQIQTPHVECTAS